MTFLGGFSVARAHGGKAVLMPSSGKKLVITKLLVVAREDTRVVFYLGGRNLCEMHGTGCRPSRIKGMEREFLFEPPVEARAIGDVLQLWSDGKVFAVVHGSEKGAE